MNVTFPHPTIETIRFDRPVPYGEAYAAQVERRRAVEADRKCNALFILEHPAVYTLGRGAHEENVLLDTGELAEMGIEVQEVDRGGDVTYHGPGQLVAYPILNLGQWEKSIAWYLRSLEEVLIAVLADYGLQGERLPGFTGVWVGSAKVAAIGVGLRNWVTFHGIALNVDTDMTHWKHIVPCGIPDKPVSSLERLLPEPPPMQEVMDRFEARFRDVFLP